MNVWFELFLRIEHINIGPSPPVCPPSQNFNIDPIKTVDVTQLAPNCSDPEDGDIKANCLPATLSRSSIGETTVICQCTDSQNLKSIPCVFSVQILSKYSMRPLAGLFCKILYLIIIVSDLYIYKSNLI